MVNIFLGQTKHANLNIIVLYNFFFFFLAIIFVYVQPPLLLPRDVAISNLISMNPYRYLLYGWDKKLQVGCDIGFGFNFKLFNKFFT